MNPSDMPKKANKEMKKVKPRKLRPHLTQQPLVGNKELWALKDKLEEEK